MLCVLCAQKNEVSFSHMDWPPQTPDLNPIENLINATMEIYAVTLHELNKTMSQRMCAVMNYKNWTVFCCFIF